MSTCEEEYEREYFDGPYADLPPKQRRELVALADLPERIQRMFEDVADYIETFGGGEDVREQARFALGMPTDLFDGLLAYYEEARIQSLLNDVRRHESQLKTLRWKLRTYLDKPGEAL